MSVVCGLYERKTRNVVRLLQALVLRYACRPVLHMDRLSAGPLPEWYCLATETHAVFLRPILTDRPLLPPDGTELYAVEQDLPLGSRRMLVARALDVEDRMGFPGRAADTSHPFPAMDLPDKEINSPTL